MQQMKQYILTLLLATTLLASCTRDAAVPSESTPANIAVSIYPDYKDVTIPPNIAPLNFKVTSEGKAFVADASCGSHHLTVGADADGKICFNQTDWRELLNHAKGKRISVNIYAETDGGWTAYPAFGIDVAEEPIDPYLAYRIIEPGFELYRQIGLYQRDLTTFEQKTIYENNREYNDSDNHCVNCHNFQAYDTERMLFHVRARHGGTVFVDHGKIKKMTMTTPEVIANCVYPTWHPQRNWVVFSSNKTGQTFHIKNPQKIEVLDYGSDLVFYDADKGTLTNILKTEDYFETFPAWAPDGKKLYYCSAAAPSKASLPDSLRDNEDKFIDLIIQRYDSLRYNLYSMTFDEATRTFGKPVLEVNCDSMSQSATVPRVSPDGRYLLFTLGSFGQFHIWHRDSDQWVKDLKTGKIYPLTEANSPSVDSYHSWSSNGRWIVFSSRREDNNFTRPAIAYFDKNGQAHKAFILPQEDPDHNVFFFYSYNVPELTKNAVKVTPDELKDVIYNDAAAGKVTYKPGPADKNPQPDGRTSASPQNGKKPDGATSASPQNKK